MKIIEIKDTENLRNIIQFLNSTVFQVMVKPDYFFLNIS